ncbi:MAG: MFS transporter [Candidatus Bathyarchaeota archaeon]|nr:MFS transporter [Candidatus Bathyarchaeota archaeon]
MSKRSSLRDAFGFMHGNILVLTVTRVLGMFSRSMAFPYASLYILALGGEAAQIGFVNSLRPLAGLLMYPLAGYIADLVGRVKLIALAGYLSGVITLMYVFAPSWQMIALAGLLQGFIVFHFPASSAIIADSLPPRDRGKGIAMMSTVAGALATFSPYIAGTLIAIQGVNTGMRFLYAFLMVTNLASATITLRFLMETSERSEEKLGFSDLPRTFRNAYSGIPAMLRRLPRSLKALAGVIVLGFMANAIAAPFWVVYVVEHIGLSSVEWGLILLVEVAFRNLMFMPAGMVVDRYGRTKAMLASLLLSLASIPLFILSTGFIDVLLIRSAVAISNAFFIPACSALMADMVPRDIRGRAMAALGRGTFMIGSAVGGVGGPGMGFIITIPVMIASIAGGYLYAYNPEYPWLFVTAVTVTSIILSALFIRDPKEAEL